MSVRAGVVATVFLALVWSCAPQPAQSAADSPSKEEQGAQDAQGAPVAQADDDVPKDSARPAEWGYTGERSPDHWAELSPAYAACASGKYQSPIDIPSSSPAKAASWKVAYGTTSLRIAHHEHVHDIIDNGHTIQVTVEEGGTLTTERGAYDLAQFHFHTPSENTVDGKHFPMEMHMVHQSKSGKFAVLAIFFEEGAANPRLEQLITHFPEKKGKESAQHHPDESIDLQLHLPSDLAVYGFIGSFTTPPCTEDVEWLVLRKPVAASKQQLQAFAARLHDNNRPVQALDGRSVQAAKVATGNE